MNRIVQMDKNSSSIEKFLKQKCGDFNNSGGKKSNRPQISFSQVFKEKVYGK